MKFPVIRRGLLIIVCMALLVGCNKHTLVESQNLNKPEIIVRKLPIELYVEKKVRAGEYEPSSGIYTGAYVQKDKNIRGDIIEYETIMNQKQTFKVFSYSGQEGITKGDIFKCIAESKIPYIKLILSTDYDLTTLYQLIFDIKETYKTPIFIELYPITSKAYDVKCYRETYQRAYEILHKYLSEVVVVWSIDESRVEDLAIYYPEDSYVDWVGINIYMPRYKQGKLYKYDVLSSLEYWYKTFQVKKPLLISSLAISHFSKVDDKYALQEAKDQLTLFYNDVLQNHPRIRGILYIDLDMATINKKGKEDYSITGHPILIHTMKDLSSTLKINRNLIEREEKNILCYMKYSIMGAYIENSLYIPKEYIVACFNDLPLHKINFIEDERGDIFYSYEDIKEYYNTFYKA